MIGDYLEVYTFDYLMAQALSQVPNTVDKRQGSIIYDALAPACYRLADFYNTLRNVYKDTFAETATGESLGYRVLEQGITRYSATYAIKKAYFVSAEEQPMAVPLGARFSTISDVNPITYAVISAYAENGVVQPGYYQLQCEVSGVEGNEYSGTLTNITYVQGLASATMYELINPARDEETDDELRTRYFERVTQKAFGGNIAQYDQELKEISGVGDVQIYPVWNGGGTVKLSIVDSEYNKCSNEFVTIVQNLIDPENSTGVTGTGLGIAPIGHQVTVVTPTEYTANISATIVLMPGTSIGQVSTPIENAIEAYFATLRKNWGVSNEYNDYSLGIYISRITAAILTVPGVANVTNVQINGSAVDVALTENSTTQQLPIVGTVTINE